jgi:hypothetical protein
MDDPTDTRLPRIAPLLLLAALVGLAVVRPGNLGGAHELYRLFTGLTAVAAVGYVAWRFHGLIPAAVAILLLFVADSDNSPAAFAERATDVGLLTTLAIGIAAGSRQGRPGELPWLLTAVAAVIPVYVWVGPGVPTPVDPVGRARVLDLTPALFLLAVLVGLCARKVPWGDRLRLIGLLVGVPVVVAVTARLLRGDWPATGDANWPALVSEWQAAVRGGTWPHAAWCWATPWVTLPLVGLGLWRAFARGWQGLRKGRPPLAWLVAVATLGAIAVSGARPTASGSLALAAAGSLLSVFGVADVVLALVERIELKPPEPGPSAVPRVK